MNILIIGNHVSDTVPLEGMNHCFSVMVRALREAFEAMPHVSVSLQSIGYEQPFRYDVLPNDLDLILFCGYIKEWYELDWGRIRRWAGEPLVYTLLEVPITGGEWYPDHGFCFVQTGDRWATTIHAPCVKSLYRNVPKENRIVIDHGWPCIIPQLQSDWTLQISEWLTDLKDEYAITRIVKYGKAKGLYHNHGMDEPATVKPHESMLFQTSVGKYLAATDTAETFVVTHTESYGHSVIDMAARGIRVVAPKGFLPERGLVDHFDIPTFETKDELLALVRSPVEARWNHMIDRCTDYADVARIIDDHFKGEGDAG